MRTYSDVEAADALGLPVGHVILARQLLELRGKHVTRDGRITEEGLEMIRNGLKLGEGA